MVFTMKQLKIAVKNISDGFGVDTLTASKIVGYYNAGINQNPDIVQALIDNDLTMVPAACSALGIKLDHEKKIPEKKTKKPVKASKNHGPVKDHDCIQGGDGPQDNDIIPADIMGEGLPAGLVDDLKQCITDFGLQNNIDVMRMTSQQWRACCMYIGQYIKQRGILRDRDREKHHGGIIYNPQRLESLLNVWAFLCGVYKMIPLVPDFVSFSGVSRQYFYDFDGQGLTSSSVQIAKKARAIEEAGFLAGVSGGGASAVGSMFALKTRHNYSETVTVQHTSTAAALGLSELPKLTENTL